jgi:hypothetical protein
MPRPHEVKKLGNASLSALVLILLLVTLHVPIAMRRSFLGNLFAIVVLSLTMFLSGVVSLLLTFPIGIVCHQAPAELESQSIGP